MMNLTVEYLDYILGNIDREYIINMVDRAVSDNSNPSEDMIDLSLSADVDDYEFGKLIKKFVEIPFPNQVVIDAVIRSLMRNLESGSRDMLEGIREFRYNYDVNRSVIDLYNVLDHYWNKEPKWHSSRDVHSYIISFIDDANKLAQQVDSAEAATNG